MNWTESYSKLEGKSNRFWSWMFVLVFAIACLGNSYHEILFKRPQGIHVWRQTDCASMALNYHQKETSMLKPRMHYQLNEKGEALGEFPILYYAVGKLYDVFGYHEFIYRLFWLLLAFAGSYSLYLLSFAILGKHIESIGIGMMLMFSPVISFYTVSFLSDPAALYITCVALLLLFKAHQAQNMVLFYTAILLVSLAGLLKVSALIIPFSLLGVYCLAALFQKKWFHAMHAVIGVFVVGLSNFAWYAYAIEVNTANDTYYFFTRTASIWELDGESMSELAGIVYRSRLSEFYNDYMLLTGLLFLIIALVKAPFNRWWSLFIFLGFIGQVAFILLFFQQFRYHDYYMINIVLWIPMVFLFAFKALNQKSNKKLITFLRLLFIVMVVKNGIMASNFVNKRFEEDTSSYYSNKGYADIEPYLTEIGIGKEDKVISIPDESPNTTLYLMNRGGWSNLYHQNMSRDDVDVFKSLGAKYLIIGDSALAEDSIYQEYTRKEIGRYKEIRIFKL